MSINTDNKTSRPNCFQRYVKLVVEAYDMERQTCSIYCARKWNKLDKTSMDECAKKCADFKQLSEWSGHN